MADSLAVNDHFLARPDGDHLDHDFLFNDCVNDTDFLFVSVQLVITSQVDPSLIAQVFTFVGITLQLFKQLGHLKLPALVQALEIGAGFGDQQDAIELRNQFYFPAGRPSRNGF